MAAKPSSSRAATSGIGEVAAVALAEQGARIVLIARDRGARRRDAGEAAQRESGRTHTVALSPICRGFREMKRVAERDRGSRAQDRRAHQQCRRAVQRRAR